MSSARLHRIAIIGGGFAGLSVARRLRGAPAEITLIDKQNYHLFQPLLYQVASGSLAPEHITVPMRRALRGHTHARFVLGDVEDFDLSRRRIILRDGLVEFDSLVLAAGMSPSYFGNDAWRAHTIPLKSLPDAMDIRHAVLEALEHAERAHDPAQVRAYLTFVIVGGGPTGVELAGSLTELLHDIGRDNFSQIDPASATILLIEGGERVLAPFGEPLGVRAMADLRALRVQVRVGSRVKEVGEGFVTVQMGGEQIVRVPTHTVLWAAGMQAPAVGRALARVTAAVQDPSGRIVVQPDLSVPNHRNIFVVGDLANCVQKGKALPGIAPVAMQQGDYVGQLLAARLRGRSSPPFRYKDVGTMAIIARGRAIAQVGHFRMSGFWGWLAWLAVHLAKLAGFSNRLLVIAQWAVTCFLDRHVARPLVLPSKRPAPMGQTQDTVRVAANDVMVR